MSKLTQYFAPAGSVIAKLLPGGGDELFLPFFSSHFMLPIKVGEVVWVLYPDATTSSASGVPSEMEGISVDSKILQGGIAKIGSAIKNLRRQSDDSPLFRRAVVTKVLMHHMYLDPDPEEGPVLSDPVYNNHGGFWITRITGTRLSEDLNFTHIDRDLDLRSMCTLAGKDPHEVLGFNPDGDPQEYFPNFPNGIQAMLDPDSDIDNDQLGEENHSFTLGNTADAYDVIQSTSKSVREPVPPPYKHKPGEFVINGSNNTRIMLGTLGSPVKASPTDEPGSNLSQGIISLTVGHGLAGAGTINPIQSAGSLGAYEQEKCPELRSDIEVSLDDPNYVNWVSSMHGASSPQAELSIMTSANPNGKYIDGASYSSTFPSTVKNAEPVLSRPANVHQVSTQVDTLVVGCLDEPGSVITGLADHIRFGGRESLRIGVDGGAEIILHRDGNIFLKPGPDGQVYLGGGPDELVDELATDDMEVATYCDIVTYPSADPALGLAAEMGMINKLPEPAKASGRRYSPKVKVKS